MGAESGAPKLRRATEAATQEQSCMQRAVDTQSQDDHQELAQESKAMIANHPPASRAQAQQTLRMDDGSHNAAVLLRTGKNARRPPITMPVGSKCDMTGGFTDGYQKWLCF